jgi:hypothetical protein
MPSWAADIDRLLPDILVGDIEIWRAANQVEPADRRPTGSEQLGQARRNWQQRLNQRLATGNSSVEDCIQTP